MWPLGGFKHAKNTTICLTLTPSIDQTVINNPTMYKGFLEVPPLHYQTPRKLSLHFLPLRRGCPTKIVPKIGWRFGLSILVNFGPFFRLRPPSTKCLKGSPYQKNVLANVVGHRKHMEGGWCFFTSSFIYGLQGPSNVFGLKFRPTSLRFVPSFQQTPRTRGLNGKNYRKTLQVLIVGLLETIRCGLFFSQNICKYGH